jgi:hypothetical protein
VVQPELNESSTLFVRMDTKRVGNAVTAKLNGKKSFILNDNSNPWLTNSKADKDKSPYCYIIRIDLNIVDHSLIRICNRDYMC